MRRTASTTPASLLAALTACALLLHAPSGLAGAAATASTAAASRPPPLPAPASLEQLAPGLLRYNFRYKFVGLPGPIASRLPVPIATFLLSNQGAEGRPASDWLLVDAGCVDDAEREWATELTDAVAQAVGAGTLHAILVTHSHADHVGALPQLLARFPAAKVITHRAERPFLVEGKTPAILQGDSLVFNLFKRAPLPWNVTAPKERVLFLSGEAGELADVAGALGSSSSSSSLSSAGLRQLLGAWRWLHVPGHTPGMIALYHKPTNSVLAADAYFNPKLPWQSKATLREPFSFATFNRTQAAESMAKLADLGFSRMYPSHDNATGVSLEQARALLASKGYLPNPGEEL